MRICIFISGLKGLTNLCDGYHDYFYKLAQESRLQTRDERVAYRYHLSFNYWCSKTSYTYNFNNDVRFLKESS